MKSNHIFWLLFLLFNGVLAVAIIETIPSGEGSFDIAAGIPDTDKTLLTVTARWWCAMICIRRWCGC